MKRGLFDQRGPFERRERFIWWTLWALLVLFSLGFAACNAFEGIEEAKDAEDKLVHANRLLSENECYQARDVLLTVSPQTDESRAALGWSHLCIAGASAANITLSIYKYTSASLNTAVIGMLARTLLPMSGDKFVATQEAINTFSGITDLNKQGIEAAIAHFVRAAAILANQAGSNGIGTLDKEDISPAGCSDSCTTCATAGISDADVTAFSNNIAAAAAALNTVDANDLRSLAAALNSGLAGAADVGRCFIYKGAIPSP